MKYIFHVLLQVGPRKYCFDKGTCNQATLSRASGNLNPNPNPSGDAGEHVVTFGQAVRVFGGRGDRSPSFTFWG